MRHRVLLAAAGLVTGLIAAALLVGCSSDADRSDTDRSAEPPSSSEPVASSATAADPTTTSTAPPPTTTDPAAFARLEEAYAARLGVYAVDTGTGATVEHRADERFAYASTHKALSVAAVLRATEPTERDEVVRFTADEVVGRSPVTEQHVDTGLPLVEVMRAAITVSDNTAANLLLEELGGPEGFEAALRAVGDDTTSADRWEPDLGAWAPGETRDTSTPRAMAANLRTFALGDVLAEADRAFLLDALRANTTGDELIRAAVPEGWVVGDKTGSAAHGGRNDIAIVEPPGRAPIVIAVYSNRLDPEAESDPALIAAAAEVVLGALAG